VTTPTLERCLFTEWPERIRSGRIEPLLPSNALVFTGTSGRIVSYSYTAPETAFWELAKAFGRASVSDGNNVNSNAPVNGVPGIGTCCTVKIWDYHNALALPYAVLDSLASAEQHCSQFLM
jgi:hypothetical protein